MSLQREFEFLKVNTYNLVCDIREFSEDQAHLWQQVPFLALQADGRNGYSDNRSRAYCAGLWALNSTVDGGYYGIMVDLEKGRLLSANDFTRAALDKDVLRLAANLKEINVAMLLRKLREEAKAKIFSSHDQKVMEKWRAQIIKEFDLNPTTYKRKVSLAVLQKNRLEDYG